MNPATGPACLGICQSGLALTPSRVTPPPSPHQQGETAADVFESLRKPGGVQFTGLRWTLVSKSAKDLIVRLLEKDPSARMHAQDALKHPWMAKFAAVPTALTRSVSLASGTSGHAALPPFLPTLLPPLEKEKAEGGQDRVGSFDSANGCEGAMASAAVRQALGGSLKGGGSVRGSTGSLGGGSQRGITGGSGRGIGRTASVRVFLSPENARVRVQLHGFIDAFKHRVEEPYTELMKATGPEAAAASWEAVCAGLATLDQYLNLLASPEGPFFLGDEPSLAEAATAPALFRMMATLPAVRDLDLVAACDELKLDRVSAWITEVLARPEDCCDVAVLPPAEYVHLVRRLHVKFVGPPTPTASSTPRMLSPNGSAPSRVSQLSSPETSRGGPPPLVCPGSPYELPASQVPVLPETEVPMFLSRGDSCLDLLDLEADAVVVRDLFGPAGADGAGARPLFPSAPRVGGQSH